MIEVEIDDPAMGVNCNRGYVVSLVVTFLEGAALRAWLVIEWVLALTPPLEWIPIRVDQRHQEQAVYSMPLFLALVQVQIGKTGEFADRLVPPFFQWTLHRGGWGAQNFFKRA